MKERVKINKDFTAVPLSVADQSYICLSELNTSPAFQKICFKTCSLAIGEIKYCMSQKNDSCLFLGNHFTPSGDQSDHMSQGSQDFSIALWLCILTWFSRHSVSQIVIVSQPFRVVWDILTQQAHSHRHFFKRYLCYFECFVL